MDNSIARTTDKADEAGHRPEISPFGIYLVREARRSIRDAGLTLAEVSRLTGIRPSTLSRSFNRKRIFFVPELIDIARVTGADIGRWLEVAEQKAEHGILAEVGR